MTKKEYADRNIGLAFDFIKQIIDHPDILDTIPDNAELDFVEKDTPVKLKPGRKGKKVVLYKVEHVFAPVKS